VTVLVVTQAPPAVLAACLRSHPLPFPAVADPDRVAYRAFGLERTRWRDFFRPAVVWGYLRLILRGRLPRLPFRDEDVLQLGGDFLIDRAGRVAFAHRSRTATDRPAAGRLLAAAGA
jgi:hypothetical protein